jgi:hypothetical protein
MMEIEGSWQAGRMQAYSPTWWELWPTVGQLSSGVGSECANYGSFVVELTILRHVKRESFWFYDAKDKFIR